MVRDDVCVLVLGAGASKPYGFPLGGELLVRVRDWLGKDASFNYSLLRETGFSPRDADRLRQLLVYGAYPSVDAAIAAESNLADIGKAAMAIDLLTCERGVDLFETPGRLGPWYHLLAGYVSQDEAPRVKVSVVTFNYDISLEMYLYTMLRRGRGMNDNIAADRMERLPTIHVHGTLRDPGEAARTDAALRGELSRREVVKAVKAIRVLPEAKKESHEFRRARTLIRDAQSVWLLGMGFHHLNLERLGLVTSDGQLTEVAGEKHFVVTHKGLSVEQWNRSLGSRLGRYRTFAKPWGVSKMVGSRSWH